MIKAPPPLVAACTGNLKKFPRPTALPATARMTPIFELQLSLEFFIFYHKNSCGEPAGR
jgi:hypothetical protein